MSNYMPFKYVTFEKKFSVVPWIVLSLTKVTVLIYVEFRHFIHVWHIDYFVRIWESAFCNKQLQNFYI